MKYKVGDKVAVRGEVTRVGQEDCYYVNPSSRGWTHDRHLINPLSAINRAKAYQMHYKRVKRELDEARKDAAMWRELFDELYKQYGERSMKHKQELFDEQESYAELAGKYVAAINTQDELLRDLRRWKINYWVMVAAVVFMGLLQW